jgi:hypothetical protein
MANQLKKLADVQYTPGRPYVPAQPAYCYWESVQSPGSWVLRTETTPGVITIWYEYVPGRVTSKRVCVPGVPARSAIPARTTYTAIIGWNAGGRSVHGIDTDGYFEFKIGPAPIGVVVGLVSQNITTLPTEASHAFYAHDTVVEVVEFGQVVATAPSAFSAANPMRISRSGSQITYTYDGWSYTSTEPSFDTQFLDASLYYTGDSVVDPVIGLAADVDGVVDAALSALSGLASDFDYDVDGGYGQVAGVLPRLTGVATLVNTRVYAASGTLPSLTGLASDFLLPYGQVSGALPSITGDASGGFPAPAFVYGYGILPALSGASIALVGQAGEVDAELPLLAGMATDRLTPWGQAYGTLRALQGGAVLTTPAADRPTLRQGFALGDYFYAPLLARETIREGLQLASQLDATITVSESYLDGLIMQDTYSVSQVLQAIINAGLVLGGASDPSIAPTQYAVNILTGALSTYEGFDFRGFCTTGGQTYAVRADGLYRIRPGDDNGVPITVDIDLGADGFGTPNAKTIEAVYLGVATDGIVYLRANVDGTERRYRVVQRDPMMRALLARGVTGRRWNLALEVVDATEMELDLVEILVAVNQRRWTR